MTIKNLGMPDRFLRLLIALVLLGYGAWNKSWLVLLLGLFTLYEAFASWCPLYQLLGINSSCALSNTESKNRKGVGSLFVFFLICFGTAELGKESTQFSVMTWYSTLIKPYGTPPSWVFGPVWMVLYTLIAISGWLIYRENSSSSRTWALNLYIIQLGLNALWSPFFFWMQNPELALITISLLWITLIASISYFFRFCTLAAILFIPYFLWVTYALYLNAGIVLLN